MAECLSSHGPEKGPQGAVLQKPQQSGRGHSQTLLETTSCPPSLKCRFNYDLPPLQG